MSSAVWSREWARSARVRILRGRLLTDASTGRVVHFSATLHAARARLLHGAARARGWAEARASAGWNSTHMALRHRLPQTCSLLLERRWTRQVVACRAYETLRSSVVHRGWRRGASARRQTCARRDHGQITRHHARATYLFAARSHGPDRT